MNDGPLGFRTQPHNVDAEQAVLGAILINNAAYDGVAFLRPEHFYESVHGRMFEIIKRLIESGRVADAVTLKVAFDEDANLRELNGADYLARLTRAAETILNAEDYGRHLVELAVRRALIRSCEAAANAAYDTSQGAAINGELVHLRGSLDIIERESSNGADKQQPVFLTAPDFVAGYKPRRPLIKAWDTRPGWLYSFTAPTGFAKTAIALGEALNQASAGRSVLYLAGENADDVRARMLVMQDRLGIEQLPATLRFVDRTFNMPETMEFVRGEVRDAGGADLIFVDTSPAFQAVSGGVDENLNTEQLRWAMLLREMTKFEGNPAVIALCHPTKRPQTVEECIPRGGGSFLAEVDGNYVSWLKADDGERKFFDFTWTGKFRGGFEPLSYVVEVATCDALADPDGNLNKTVWAHATDEQQLERAAREQNDAEDVALKVMADYPNKSLAAWAGLLGWQKWQMQRVVDRLYRDKLAQKYRNHYRLTRAGKEEAAAASERVRSGAT